MSRKFIGLKEIQFINRVNEELIQAVIGQEVTYYAIIAEKTKTNDLYDEAITKVWSEPTKINCLIYYENTTEAVGVFNPDAKFKVDVYFHTYELAKRNVKPRMGDFVQFGEVLYEIYSVTMPQIIAGQIEQKIMTKCVCGPARKGQMAPPKQPLPTPTKDVNANLYPDPSGPLSSGSF